MYDGDRERSDLLSMRLHVVSADDASEPGDVYRGQPAEVAALARDRAVPCHSISGDCGLGNGIQRSDGVVPSLSAPREGVEADLLHGESTV